MNRITVVGLGNGTQDQLTLGAASLLLEGKKLVLRTEKHGVVPWLLKNDIIFDTLDALYEEAEDFDQLEAACAQKVIEYCEKWGDVIYAIPGDGITEDGTVMRLLEEGGDREIDILPGVSDSVGALSVMKQAIDSGILMIPAAVLDRYMLTGRVPVLVTQLNDTVQAGQVKLILSSVYGDEAICRVTHGGKADKVQLYQLDWLEDLDHTSSVYLGVKDDHGRYGFADVVEQMMQLRAPGGCPWDREQTHESLRQSMIEECYEAIQTIDDNDMQSLMDELGDVLLQVIFHSELGDEDGDFDILDVTDNLYRKLFRRHPHIFGKTEVHDSQDVHDNWLTIKRQEKGQTNDLQVIQDVPVAMPAIMRSEKLQKKAEKAGYLKSSRQDAVEKIRRMLSQLSEDKGDVTETIGDLLFALVALSRHFGISPEMALRQANDRFLRGCEEMGS